MPLFSSNGSICPSVADDDASIAASIAERSCFSTDYQSDEYLIDEFLERNLTEDDDDDDSSFYSGTPQLTSRRSFSRSSFTSKGSSASRDLALKALSVASSTAASSSTRNSNSLRLRQLERAARRRRYTTEENEDSVTNTTSALIRRSQLAREKSQSSLLSSRPSATTNRRSGSGGSLEREEERGRLPEQDDKDYLMMMISPGTDDEDFDRERFADRVRRRGSGSPTRRNYLSRKNSGKKKQNDKDDDAQQHDVESLLAELEKFKFKFAQAQSEADHYKLQYRHLHEEYTEMQAHSYKLENEIKTLKYKQISKKGYISSNTSVTSNTSATSVSSNASWFVQSLERIIPTSTKKKQKLQTFKEFPDFSDCEENQRSMPDSDFEDLSCDEGNSDCSEGTPQLGLFLATQPAEFEKPVRDICFNKRNQLKPQISQLSLAVTEQENRRSIGRDNDSRADSYNPNPASITEDQVLEEEVNPVSDDDEEELLVEPEEKSVKSGTGSYKCTPLKKFSRAIDVDSEDLDELYLSESQKPKGGIASGEQ